MLLAPAAKDTHSATAEPDSELTNAKSLQGSGRDLYLAASADTGQDGEAKILRPFDRDSPGGFTVEHSFSDFGVQPLVPYCKHRNHIASVAGPKKTGVLRPPEPVQNISMETSFRLDADPPHVVVWVHRAVASHLSQRLPRCPFNWRSLTSRIMDEEGSCHRRSWANRIARR